MIHHITAEKVKNHGFTLIELLMVIAVIVILFSLLLVASRGILDKSREVTCVSNMRSLGSMLSLYTNMNGTFPKPQTYSYDGWIETLIDFHDGMLDPALFKCPSDNLERTRTGDVRSYGVNNYLCDNDGLIQSDENPTSLVMLGEISTSIGVIGSNGASNLYGVFNLSALHGGGTKTNVLFLDGHVESLVKEYNEKQTAGWWYLLFKGRQN